MAGSGSLGKKVNDQINGFENASLMKGHFSNTTASAWATETNTQLDSKGGLIDGMLTEPTEVRKQN